MLVNGAPTSEFQMGRGVRQGDPLSSFLFLIVAEGINDVIKEDLDNGVCKGIVVGSEEVRISHFQFADDSLFFEEWNLKNLIILMGILKCFQEASGLKINMSKSKLCGLGVPGSEVEMMAQSLGCASGCLPFNYLGLQSEKI